MERRVEDRSGFAKKLRSSGFLIFCSFGCLALFFTHKQPSARTFCCKRFGRVCSCTEPSVQEGTWPCWSISIVNLAPLGTLNPRALLCAVLGCCWLKARSHDICEAKASSSRDALKVMLEEGNERQSRGTGRRPSVTVLLSMSSAPSHLPPAEQYVTSRCLVANSQRAPQEQSITSQAPPLQSRPSC